MPLNKSQREPTGQSINDNPETLTTSVSSDTIRRQTKEKDTTMKSKKMSKMSTAKKKGKKRKSVNPSEKFLLLITHPSYCLDSPKQILSVIEEGKSIRENILCKSYIGYP